MHAYLSACMLQCVHVCVCDECINACVCVCVGGYKCIWLLHVVWMLLRLLSIARSRGHGVPIDPARITVWGRTITPYKAVL